MLKNEATVLADLTDQVLGLIDQKCDLGAGEEVPPRLRGFCLVGSQPVANKRQECFLEPGNFLVPAFSVSSRGQVSPLSFSQPRCGSHHVSVVCLTVVEAST